MTSLKKNIKHQCFFRLKNHIPPFNQAEVLKSEAPSWRKSPVCDDSLAPKTRLFLVRATRRLPVLMVVLVYRMIRSSSSRHAPIHALRCPWLAMPMACLAHGLRDSGGHDSVGLNAHLSCKKTHVEETMFLPWLLFTLLQMKRGGDRVLEIETDRGSF